MRTVVFLRLLPQKKKTSKDSGSSQTLTATFEYSWRFEILEEK
jgi:hypothetical protein